MINKKKLFSFIILTMFCIGIISSQFIIKVGALPINVNSNSAGTSSGCTCNSISVTLSVTAGNVIVVIPTEIITSFTPPTASISDSVNSYTQIGGGSGNNPSATGGSYAGVEGSAWGYETTALTTTTLTITVTYSTTVFAAGINVWQLRGTSITQESFTTGNSNSSSSIASVSTLTPSHNDIILAGAAEYNAGVISAGSGYALINGQAQYSSNGYETMGENTTTSSPTTAPFTNSVSFAGWDELAMAFTSATLSPITITLSDSITVIDSSIGISLGTIPTIILSDSLRITDYLSVNNILSGILITLSDSLKLTDNLFSALSGAFTTVVTVIVGCPPNGCTGSPFVNSSGSSFDLQLTSILFPAVFLMVAVFLFNKYGVQNDLIIPIALFIILGMSWVKILPSWIILIVIIITGILIANLISHAFSGGNGGDSE